MSEGDKLNYTVNLITNDTLKAHFINSKLGSVEINNLTEFNSTFQPIKKYLILDASKKSYAEKLKEVISDTLYVGKQIADFSFPDTSGKMVSFKSLRGKVVLIDVWATWCGPCKGQIPFLTQIEEEYHNRDDIAFVSLSLDRVADHQTWIDFVKNGKLGNGPLKPGETVLKLGGIQLIDHSGKEFAKKYAIYAIPRFILVDKQGKIVEISLPVPDHHDAFTNYLNTALAKN
ncbi:TlpA family protein disulfide reductase [Mucilaginibacter sp. AW1-3]